MGNEGDGFMAFNGKTFRSIGDSGMTAIGQRRKDQICMVYENPLDFLALMVPFSVCFRHFRQVFAEERPGTPIHIVTVDSRALHGIVDGGESRSAKLSFRQEAAHLKKVGIGFKIFAGVSKASLASMAIEEDKSRNVGQGQPKPKLKITPLLGGEKSAVIERKTGGLKL